MRIGVTLDENNGLASQVSAHFGQCKYFLLADIEDGKLIHEKVVPNEVVHGGGGCVTVDGLLKHDITHVISGGMGAGAQNKFAMNNIQVFGYEGAAKDAIDALLKNNIGGLGACSGHGDCN